ncbi:Hypothetical protein CAP_1002 [Chondromyces apiculatus DSM 436]|uniref:Uncharacterized protein n=1 Tax=Chondromyces apiculatus DSM 436 TaxID=1192034 RepID=A0A017STE4_9BACT|nr:Hypothetical protein CAP_1002 [Chondromyces apiculatus DSM 436]
MLGGPHRPHASPGYRLRQPVFSPHDHPGCDGHPCSTTTTRPGSRRQREQCSGIHARKARVGARKASAARWFPVCRTAGLPLPARFLRSSEGVIAIFR